MLSIVHRHLLESLSVFNCFFPPLCACGFSPSQEYQYFNETHTFLQHRNNCTFYSQPQKYIATLYQLLESQEKQNTNDKENQSSKDNRQNKS